MAAKSPTRKWADIQLAIAAVSMTTVLALWNMFAGPDRQKAAEKSLLEQASPTPSPTETPVIMPIVTMPPPGYTIVFGGEAPKPQVIVQKARGGGGGSGGSGGEVVTSTGSS